MTRRSRSLRVERLEDRQNPTSLAIGALVPDPTFGTGGTTYINPDLGPLYANVADAEVDARGRIWILGSLAGIPTLARFLPDGTPDASFDGDGILTLPPWTESIASLYLNQLDVLPDGRAVVAGQSNRNPYSIPAPTKSADLTIAPYPYPYHGEFVAIRLSENGSLDPTFGDGGRALLDLDVDGQEYENFTNLLALEVLDDGRIAFGGNVGTYYFGFPHIYAADSIPPPYPAQPRFALGRLTADGWLDAGYGDDGAVTFAAREASFENFNALTLRGDGIATVLGTRSTTDSTRAFATAYRFDAAGKPDATFDGDGHAEVKLDDAVPVINGYSTISASGGWAADQADGGTVYGTVVYRSEYRPDTLFSNSNSDLTVIRFNADGSVDAGFGTGGSLVRNQSKYASDVLPVPNTYMNVVGLQTFADGTIAILETTTAPSFVYPATGALNPVYGPPAATTTLARYDASGRPLGDLLRGHEFFFHATNPTGQNIQPREVFFDAKSRLIAVGTTDTSSVTGTRIAASRLVPVEPLQNEAEQTIFVSPGNGEVVAVRVDANSPAIVGPGSQPFGQFDGEVQALLADLDGDGRLDEIYGIGEGGGSMILAYFRNADGTVVETANFSAFEETFRGGIAIAAGDLDGDGQAEVILSAGNGGGGRVQIYSISRTGREKRADFFGIDDDDFRGGATTALADLDYDGKPELLVAAGEGGGPRIAVFDGETLLSQDVGLAPPKMMNDFFAFGGDDAGRMRNGVTVSAADLNGDGRQDLIFGAGVGGARRVLGIDGKQFLNGNSVSVVNFFVGNDEGSREGVQVSVKDVNQDGRPDLVVGRGPQLRIYDGDQLSSGNGQEPGVLRDVIVFADGAEGIFVG